MKCVHCGYENNDSRDTCWSCGHPLENDYFLNRVGVLATFSSLFLGSKTTNRVFTIVLLFLFIPLILLGLVFSVIGGFHILSDYNKTKDYLQIEGKLVQYKDCRQEEEMELCSALYEYVVDGKTYQASPNLISSKEEFQPIATVSYNPKNPQEFVMGGESNFLLITGIIMIGIALFLIISIRSKISKSTEQGEVIRANYGN